jgi:hypothetical protein
MTTLYHYINKLLSKIRLNSMTLMKCNYSFRHFVTHVEHFQLNICYLRSFIYFSSIKRLELCLCLYNFYPYNKHSNDVVGLVSCHRKLATIKVLFPEFYYLSISNVDVFILHGRSQITPILPSYSCPT